MRPEFWEQVRQLFEAGVNLDRGEREVLVANSCAGDGQLADELKSLFDADLRTALFLETPAAELLNGNLSLSDRTPAGTGPWRIVDRIGRGGMADVYLAERSDGQFRKRAALKVLQAGLFGDDVRERFSRERQVLADLDHPNIVRLIDGGVAADHRPYLVMDFVDGVRITEFVRSNDLSRKQILELFLKVCDAAAYAHRHGVVHRDLKPANIMVTGDGTPKLLDFGIAKLLQSVPAGVESTITRTRCFTLEYASPEQLLDEPVAASSDLYSLGVLLFQVLLDRHPFQLDGLAPHDAARIVCEHTPDTSLLPPRLARIVAKATRKTPAERYAGIDEFAADIRGYLEAPGLRFSRRTVRNATTAAVLAAGLAGAGFFIPRLRHQQAETKPGALQRLTAYPGYEGRANLSHRGGEVVFERRGGGIRGLWIHTIVTGGDTQLTDGADCCAKWSPGDSMIAFARRVDAGISDIMLVDRLGGPSRKIAQTHGSALSWAPEGKTLAVVDRSSPEEPPSVYLISLDGRVHQRLSHPPNESMGETDIAFSPDGKTIAAIRYASVGNGDIYVVPSAGGPESRVTAGEGWINGIAWTADGRELLFASTRAKAGNQAGIWRVPAGGGMEPRLVTKGNFPRSHPLRPTLSGQRLVFEGDQWRSNLWKMAIGTGAALPVRVIASGHGEETPAYSPDGKRVAFFFNPRGDGHHEIATANMNGSDIRQITFKGMLYTRNPSWSPDGARVAYTANVEGRRALFVVPATGGEARRLPVGDFDVSPPSWSHDSRWIFYAGGKSGLSQLWKISAEGNGEPVQVTQGSAVEGFESADGKTLYFLPADGSGILHAAKPGGGSERVVPGAPKLQPGYWTYARNKIYFFDLAWDKTGLDRFPVQSFDPVNRKLEGLGWIEGSDQMMPGISVRLDGKEVVWCKRDLGADLLMLDNVR